jgi:23S rRNA pseudouridine2605 synthase
VRKPGKKRSKPETYGGLKPAGPPPKSERKQVSSGDSRDRLQKIISQAGVASRRAAEQMILDGRVTVNGAIVTELGTRAELGRDHIKVDGKLLQPPKRLIYLAFNKPDAVVTTLSDPEGRHTILRFLKGVRERVYPVGRLDYHSEGLLLLTNDGELANRIMSKRYRVIKTYVVKANGTLTIDEEEMFRTGISLSGQRTAPAGLKLIKRGENPWYEVQLTEGRQNQIRTMFRHFGLLVEKLRRVKIGFLALDVEPGAFRHLTAQEVERFRRIVGLETAAPSPGGFIVTRAARPAAGPAAAEDDEAETIQPSGEEWEESEAWVEEPEPAAEDPGQPGDSAGEDGAAEAEA